MYDAPNLSGLDRKKAANVGVGGDNTFINWNDNDRSVSDYLPFLYLLLIALYGEHLPGGIADFADLVRYVNERGCSQCGLGFLSGTACSAALRRITWECENRSA